MHTNVRAALLNPKSEMTTVFYAAMAALGHDPSHLALDFESVLRDLEDGLGQTLPATNRIKLITAQKIAYTDLVYKDEAEFNFAAVVTQTPETPPSLSDWEPADLEDVAWLMVEVQIIDTAADEDFVEEEGQNWFSARKRPEDYKAAPIAYSEQVWKLCGALLALEGVTKPISTLPQAIVTKPDVDENMDPDLYASLDSRSRDIEQEVAQYVVDRLTVLLAQLQKIPNADGQPLVTKEMSQEWLATITKDLIKQQPDQTAPESGLPV